MQKGAFRRMSDCNGNLRTAGVSYEERKRCEGNAENGKKGLNCKRGFSGAPQSDGTFVALYQFLFPLIPVTSWLQRKNRLSTLSNMLMHEGKECEDIRSARRHIGYGSSSKKK